MSESRERRVWQVLRDHPVVTTVFTAGAVLGAVLGLLYLDPEWSAVRRLAAGTVAGLGVGLLVTATKLFD